MREILDLLFFSWQEHNQIVEEGLQKFFVFIFSDYQRSVRQGSMQPDLIGPILSRG